MMGHTREAGGAEHPLPRAGLAAGPRVELVKPQRAVRV
jgi:hypothetical protein